LGEYRGLVLGSGHCRISFVSPCTTSPSLALRSALVAAIRHPRPYRVQVPIDPTPYLSTAVLTSAALVAIIGGLLVAKFVGLDSDQRTVRKVIKDATERRDLARNRARSARKDVLRWDAGEFFKKQEIVKAVVDYSVMSPDKLVQIARWPHSPDELAPFAAEAMGVSFQVCKPLQRVITHCGQ